MIKVYVVDDHDLVRMGVTRILGDIAGIEVVGEACSGEEALSGISQANVDVVLMDAKMPGIGGLEATRKLLRQNPDLKVIALTAIGEEPFPSRFLQAGAAGYLTKGSPTEEMIKAIRLVQSGQRFISQDIAQQLALKPFNPAGGDSPFDRLSEREMQIVIMIVGCQKVQEISDKLFLSPKTVNNYRYRIFDKLDINSDVELTLLAIRHGLLDVDAP